MHMAGKYKALTWMRLWILENSKSLYSKIFNKYLAENLYQSNKVICIIKAVCETEKHVRTWSVLNN